MLKPDFHSLKRYVFGAVRARRKKTYSLAPAHKYNGTRCLYRKNFQRIGLNKDFNVFICLLYNSPTLCPATDRMGPEINAGARVESNTIMCAFLLFVCLSTCPESDFFHTPCVPGGERNTQQQQNYVKFIVFFRFYAF